MFMDPERGDPPKIGRTGAAKSPVNRIAAIEQELGEICSVLARNSSNERDLSSVFVHRSNSTVWILAVCLRLARGPWASSRLCHIPQQPSRCFPERRTR